MKESDFQSTLSDATSGDLRALMALYAEYHRMLVRYLRPQAPGFGEKLAHQTWTSVAQRLNDFSGTERDFRVVLLSEADEQIAAHQRSAGPVIGQQNAPRLIDLRSSPVGDEPVADAAIAELLQGLSPHQAQILLLRVVGGLTAEETAGLLLEPPATIRLTEHEALQQIANRLQREHGMAENPACGEAGGMSFTALISVAGLPRSPGRPVAGETSP